MELIVNLPPKECLDRAESFALSQGGSIKERTGESVTFERRPPVTCGEWVLILLASVFTFGIALLYLVFRFWFTAQVRVIARPLGRDRTRMLIDGKHEGYRAEMEEWARTYLNAQ